MSVKFNRFATERLPLLFFSSFAIALFAQMLFITSAQAECKYEGKTYQTGETAGPYVCMPSGNWSQE